MTMYDVTLCLPTPPYSAQCSVPPHAAALTTVYTRCVLVHCSLGSHHCTAAQGATKPPFRGPSVATRLPLRRRCAATCILHGQLEREFCAPV